MLIKHFLQLVPTYTPHYIIMDKVSELSMTYVDAALQFEHILPLSLQELCHDVPEGSTYAGIKVKDMNYIICRK